MLLWKGTCFAQRTCMRTHQANSQTTTLSKRPSVAAVVNKHFLFILSSEKQYPTLVCSFFTDGNSESDSSRGPFSRQETKKAPGDANRTGRYGHGMWLGHCGPEYLTCYLRKNNNFNFNCIRQNEAQRRSVCLGIACIVSTMHSYYSSCCSTSF